MFRDKKSSVTALGLALSLIPTFSRAPEKATRGFLSRMYIIFVAKSLPFSRELKKKKKKTNHGKQTHFANLDTSHIR